MSRFSSEVVFGQASVRVIVVCAILMTVLIIGRTFLIPLAIAILIWVLLSALIDRLAHLRIGQHRLPRWLATTFGIILILIGAFLVAQILSNQASTFVAALPQYEERLQHLFSEVLSTLGDDMASNARDALDNLDIFSTLSTAASSVGSVLLEVSLVTLYVAFLLIDQGSLPRKFAALFPDPKEASRVSEVMSAMAHSVRRYMWVKTLTSLMTGVASYLTLRLVDVDFAETMALIIFLLNYIPNIGSILGVIFPASVALLQFQTLVPFLVATPILIFIQVVIGNLVEPMLMGRSLNLSSFVIILALVFWGVIWGVAGMFLSVPITVMVMIICSHINGARWIAIMLSKDGEIDSDGHADTV
ncbi:MAG: AI-2E family transporter [Pseudomonadota bacterium]